MPWGSKLNALRRAPLALQCPAASDSCSPAGCIASCYALRKQVRHTPPGSIMPAVPCGMTLRIDRPGASQAIMPWGSKSGAPRRTPSAPQCPAAFHCATPAGCIASYYALRKQVRRIPPGIISPAMPWGSNYISSHPQSLKSFKLSKPEKSIQSDERKGQ